MLSGESLKSASVLSSQCTYTALSPETFSPPPFSSFRVLNNSHFHNYVIVFCATDEGLDLESSSQWICCRYVMQGGFLSSINAFKTFSSTRLCSRVKSHLWWKACQSYSHENLWKLFCSTRAQLRAYFNKNLNRIERGSAIESFDINDELTSAELH